jgi:hypothetical protein
MLTVNFSPLRSEDDQPSVSYVAPVLTIDAAAYDLSELPDGYTADHPVLGKVSRSGGDYELTLRLSHGANAPESTRFPTPLIVTADGAITLPLYDEVANELD